MTKEAQDTNGQPRRKRGRPPSPESTAAEEALIDGATQKEAREISGLPPGGTIARAARRVREAGFRIQPAQPGRPRDPARPPRQPYSASIRLQKRRIIQEELAAGKTPDQIATEHHWSRSNVYYHAKKLGYPANPGRS